MRSLFAILLVILAACRPAAPVLTPVPTDLPTLTGSVGIDSPPEGAVIYSEVLAISGTAADLPGETFVIALVGPDGADITSHTMAAASGTWAVELLHGYNGEPQEATLIARPANPAVSGQYAARTIGLSGLADRPEGTFAKITFPADGSTGGGDSLLVTGTAFGIAPPNTLAVDLVGSDGTVVSQTKVTLDDPYLIDETPWSVDLPTESYAGAATIQIGLLDAETGSRTALDSIEVALDTAAG